MMKLRTTNLFLSVFIIFGSLSIDFVEAREFGIVRVQHSGSRTVKQMAQRPFNMDERKLLPLVLGGAWKIPRKILPTNCELYEMGAFSCPLDQKDLFYEFDSILCECKAYFGNRCSIFGQCQLSERLTEAPSSANLSETEAPSSVNLSSEALPCKNLSEEVPPSENVSKCVLYDNGLFNCPPRTDYTIFIFKRDRCQCDEIYEHPCRVLRNCPPTETSMT